ncbi:MAG: hypothetical protein LBO66_08855 [Deltaproteobacteria bacterium]|jgi:hypothetical protein|nr:hypothetical protein [Deltaproteobacteria bacterium]
MSCISSFFSFPQSAFFNPSPARRLADREFGNGARRRAAGLFVLALSLLFLAAATQALAQTVYREDPFNGGAFLGVYAVNDSVEPIASGASFTVNGDVGAVFSADQYANVYGGLSLLGEAVFGNSVTVASAAAATDVHVLSTQPTIALPPPPLPSSALVTPQFAGHVIGAFSYSGPVGAAGDSHSNVVTIGFANPEDSSQNRRGIIDGSVYGGLSYLNDAIYGAVYLNNALVAGGVFGGYSDSYQVSRNYVYLFENAEVTGPVYGGLSGMTAKSDPDHESDADHNYVIVSEITSSILATFVGGSTHWGNASDNYVRVSGATLTGQVVIHGGVTNDGEASGNAVYIVDDSQISDATSTIYGAYSAAGGSASSNVVNVADIETVAIAGAIVGASVDSVSSPDFALENNWVSFNKVRFDSSLTGAFARGVNGDTVTGNGVYLSESEYAGTGGSIVGASSNAAKSVTRNYVQIRDSDLAAFTGSIVAALVSGAASEEVSENGIIMDGVNAFGANAQIISASITASITGAVKGNFVNVTGESVFGANSSIIGAQSTSGAPELSENVVYIYGKNNQFGANSFIIGADASAGTANSNVVTIAGQNDFTGATIIGGRGGTSATEAINNEVTLGMEMTGTILHLAGGYLLGTGDAFSGNSLNVVGKSGDITFGTIENFQYFSFTIDNPTVGVPVLSVGTLNLGPSGNFSEVREIILNGGKIFNQGDIITLIDATSVTTGNFRATTLTGYQSGTHEYSLNVSLQGYDVVAEVIRSALNPQLKSLAEAPIASVGLVNMGLDSLARKAIPGALISLRGYQKSVAFSSFGFGTAKYETGSKVEVNGLAGQVGVAKAFLQSKGQIVVAAFFDFGTGSYNSFNNFATAATVKGKGDLSYAGGGAFVRWDSDNPETSRLYLEASGRVGRASVSFRTSDLSFYQGESYEYKIKSPYYGFHAGVGYASGAADPRKSSWDFSAKVFYSRVAGDETEISLRKAEISDVDSLRVLAGAQFNYPLTRYIRPYFGAYLENEFNGETDLTLYGLKTESPSIKGLSGIAELGIVFKSSFLPFDIDLSLQNYFGQKKGAAGALKMNLAF